DRWSFEKPNSKNDKNSLKPIWDAAEKFLEQNSDRSVGMQEIYEIWRKPPFGVRDGLMPILAVAFVLTCRDTLALYREGIYQAKFKSLDVEYLTINPDNIQIRWMDMSEMSRGLLSGLSDVVRDLDTENKLHDLRPIDVARGLITIFDSLHPWTLRTSHLSKNALHLREIFKKAHDPNQLIFNDLPKSSLSRNKQTGHDYAEIVSCVRDGLNELIEAYPAMIERFYQIMLTDLGVPNTSSQSLADLAKRAENIRGVSGEFKLDGFAGRLIGFTGQPDQIEGLAFFAAEKPLNAWIDTDVDKSNIGIAKLSQLFNLAEAFAHVKGRKNKRQAMALVVSVDGSPTPLIEEFTISEADKKIANEIAERLRQVISETKKIPQSIILAALSKVSADYMSELSQSSTPTYKKRKTA
ncbi:MAG: hypothetical protein JKX85_08435, partial [Phycisphaeraceae bacterium]|nr:hypothetical protein [Phycisphaeraceae bacterium]